MLAEGARERGATTLDFLNPFGWGKKKQQVGSASDPGQLRAEMRYDALQAKLRKLADAVDATVKSFQHFEQVAAPQRRAAADRQYAERDLAIQRGLAGGQVSLAAQGRRISTRAERVQAAGGAQDEAAISAQESLEHGLGVLAR